MRMYIFDDRKMREHDGKAVVARLKVVLAQKSYVAGLRDKTFPWVEADPNVVVAGLIEFLSAL